MSYWRATRHPAPCLFFVLPLLIVYEYGVIALGGPKSAAVRNGADAWLRWLLDQAGPGISLFAPVAIGLVLIFRALRHKDDAPPDAPSVLLGMVIECIALAVGLWVMSRSFGPILDAMGINLSTPSAAAGGAASTPLSQAVTFLGAGIYEEVLFRLMLFGGLIAILRIALIPKTLATLLAAVLSAFGFAAVHHLGARGEAVDGYVFAFRVLAGLIFAAVYAFRGFGIAVGTHACYDVLVGIPL
ncbi:MAG: CPBP family intramembrane metalloprotease [Gemmataceae bacterium]|nr:CPBP family intramembrane metalloprotease [Gemmataceae bacterium]